MSEIKHTHTPGPWVLDDVDNHADVIADDYHFIDAGTGCTGMRDPGFGIAGCMSLADARLIASAPELLEALRILYAETADHVALNNFGDSHHNQSMRMARDALAKALGSQPR